MKISFVTTTIHVPNFLDDIANNAHINSHKDVNFLIIGDKNTPRETVEFVKSLNNRYPYEFRYYNIEEQENELKKVQILSKIMPYKSGVRKLVGNYIAYKAGCEISVMIDDDNYILDDDYISSAKIVHEPVNIPTYFSKTGWFNIYQTLIEEHNIPFYPRGFPWSKRFIDYEEELRNEKFQVCCVNGLVTNDPDIDAIARLFYPINVLDMKDNVPMQFGIYPGTWTSFNNQNTIIPRYMIPIYFTPPSAGRNSDIWTSFIICKLAEHMKEVVVFGKPLVKQLRNPHDLWDDLDLENQNNRLTDIFVKVLRNVELTSTNYKDSLEQLCIGSIRAISKLTSVNEKDRNYMQSFFEEYIIWKQCFDKED